MSYSVIREIRELWAQWAEEENRCPHCGGILPWIQRPITQIEAPIEANKKHECAHLPASFDYICALCGELVNKENL